MDLLQKAVTSIDRSNTRKGDMGRVAVIGGSRLYTGAPYFAARAAARTGADLVYVNCDNSCSIPLKTLLPEAIVDAFDEINAASSTWPWLSTENSKPHVQTFLIGCGLGKENYSRQVILRLIRLRSLVGVNIILDGDALRHTLTPELLKWIAENHLNNYYLTPNEKEYQHLSLLSDLENLPAHVCVLRKGESDRIYTSSGSRVIVHNEPKEPVFHHPGGIGDILAGVLAAVTAMTSQNLKLQGSVGKVPVPELLEVNATIASRIVRRAISAVVYSKEGLAQHSFAHFISQDVLEHIGFCAEEERRAMAKEPILCGGVAGVSIAQ